jgi:hypothetical protein
MKKTDEFDNLSTEEQLEWYKQNRAELKDEIKALKARIGPLEGFTQEKQKLFEDFMKYSIDPDGNFFGVTLESILDRNTTRMGEKIASIDSEGGINYISKGHEYDPYLVEFIHGSGGRISNWDREEHTDNALVIRGLGGGSRKAIQHCLETKRTFYAIDTGYFGNGKAKVVHRVTKNALQYLGPIVEREHERARSFGYKFKKFTPGRKILLVPPSNKVMDLFGQPSPEQWVEQVTQQLKNYTDRPIEVRLKPLRSERVSTKTMEAALADDVHCLITYNSIAAVEALMAGKPAIVLGQNAASIIAETDLSKIDRPNIPNRDEMDAYMAHLAYCQFTVPELRSGFAWNTVNESSELPIWNPTR